MILYISYYKEINYMLLEDYFHFLAPNDIRLKGTRVGIETVLYDFIYRSCSPEHIADTYLIRLRQLKAERDAKRAYAS